MDNIETMTNEELAQAIQALLREVMWRAGLAEAWEDARGELVGNMIAQAGEILGVEIL